MNRNLIETIVGGLVIVVAVVVMVFAYSTASLRPISGYELTARFDPLNKDRIQHGAAGINPSGVSRRAGADDKNFGFACFGHEGPLCCSPYKQRCRWRKGVSHQRGGVKDNCEVVKYCCVWLDVRV